MDDHQPCYEGLVIIDLTMPLGPATPVLPGDPAISFHPVTTVDREGFLVHAMGLGSHSGTHIDAPAHFIHGAPGLDGYGIERFVGIGHCLDLATATVGDLDPVEPGSIVLLHHRSAGAPDPPPPMVAALVDRRPSMVGIDAISIDAEPYRVHRALLGADILVIENLVNLDRLVGARFEVIALPLRVALEASPCRVVARLL